MAYGLRKTTTPIRSGKSTTAVRPFSQCPAYTLDILSNFRHGKKQVVFAHAENPRPIGHFVRFGHIDAAGGYRTQSLTHVFFQLKRFMKLAPLQRSRKIPVCAFTPVKGQLMAGFSFSGARRLADNLN